MQSSEMKVFYSSRQLAHRPEQFMRAGRLVKHMDAPERAEALAAALERAGYPLSEPPDFGLDPVAKVHSAGYLEFLRTAWTRWSALGSGGPEVLPNTHPYRGAGADFAIRPETRVESVIGQAGWYVGDLACPIGPETYAAAVASAHAAVAAADAVASGDGVAYALCRPPGHHAAVDRAAGFCYVNNAAIAAERLLARAKRVAVLDIDAHHGDGTQAIFYRRSDVQFVSVHTDPANFYPFYSGYRDEYGADEGEGFNLNLPVPAGSGDAEFLDALDDGLAAIRAHECEAMVISLGFDAYHLDPLSVLKVTTDGYRRIGEMIHQSDLPIVLVQEGGYEVQHLGQNLIAFLEGCLHGR